MRKNTAYAWRKMVFFLSVLSGVHGDEFLLWAYEHLGAQSADLRQRFSGVVRGPELAARGDVIDANAAQRGGVRQILGWSPEKHWLLAWPKSADPSRFRWNRPVMVK